jgi:hypothetical protein
MPTDPQSSAERFLATAMYAPFGLGAKLVEDLPSTIARVRRNIAFARFVGKIAVEKGVKEFRQRIDAPAERSVGHDEAPITAGHPSARSVDIDDPPSVDVALSASTAQLPASGDLALPDYDQLPAAHIVGKLAGLTPDERDDIETYETANRHRRTVLGKLDQLKDD